MAKKKSKSKPAKKPAAKKSTKKSRPAPKRNPLAPVPISTGNGASPMDVGTNLVKMFNAGQWEEIEKAYYSPKIVSIEGVGVSMGWHGLKAVRAKSAEWVKDNTIHSATAEGPYVGATGFAVKFSMDVETKSTGKRQNLVEVGVYSVLKGKIVQEEFMYFRG